MNVLRRFFQHFEDRADQMTGVMNRLGITPDIAGREALATDFQRMISRCIGCRAGSRCQSWLQSEGSESELAVFCPNAEAFRRHRAH